MNDAPTAASRKAIPAPYVVAVFIGNGLEFYDFLVYALFAVYIGRAFFPSTDGALSLLLSLATFGIGFVTRPIGAIVLGTLGDRIGRKPSMLISLCNDGRRHAGPRRSRRPMSGSVSPLQYWRSCSGSFRASRSAAKWVRRPPI